MKRIICIALLILLCRFSMAFDIDREYANSLTYANGLAGDNVRNMCTDHHGQVWLATSRGLTVYNGVRYHSYRFYNEKLKKKDWVFDVCEGFDNSIFVGASDGVYELKYGSDTFVNILTGLTNVENLLADEHILYIGAREGLFLYDGKHMKKVNMGKRDKLDYLPRHFVKDDKGNIWFTTRYTLCCYNPKTGKLVSKQITRQMTYNSLLSKFAISGNKVFVGTTNNGLFILNLSTGKIHQVENIGNIISSVEMIGGKMVYVATRGSGVFVLDANTENVLHHYGSMEKQQYFLPTNMVECFMQDANGVNWFGASHYGAIYSYYDSRLFETYSYGDFTTRKMDVCGFLKHGEEHLIGLQNGFWYVNEKNGTVRFFDSKELGDAHYFTKFVFFNGKYYIGSNDGGLRIFDPQTLTVMNQTYHSLLSMCSISAMKVSPDNQLYIGTNEGLFVIDKTGKCVRCAEQNSRINGGAIRGLIFDRSRNVWLGGSTGLCLFLSATRDFEASCFPKDFFNKVNLTVLTRGHQQKIYALGEGKLFETDENMTHFSELNVPQGIMEDDYRFFLDDMCGHYWLASEKGLFNMDYSLKEISYFGNSEGIRGDYVNNAWVDEDGCLWVWTSEGLSYMPLDKLKNRQKEHAYNKLLLYDIRKGAMQVDYGKEGVINDEASLTVLWNVLSSPLSFKVTFPNYAKTQGRFYEYKLDGDKEWNLISEGKEIILTDLSLGNHEVKIRLMGAPNTERVFRVLVIPSGLAIFEIIVMIAAIVFFFYWRNYRKNTHTLLVEKSQMEDALIEMEQQQEKTQDAQEVVTDKYQKIKVSEEECQTILKKMQDYMEKQHAYRNPDLKRSDIAAAIGTSVVKLSQVLNQQLNESYYAYVNHYRLEEFKQLIDAGEYKRYTVTALSERCGFKRTSFFSTFRKVEGMTPAEYLKSKNIKTTV